jgi:hypothetical protein
MRAPDKRGPIDMADIALLIADIEIVLRSRALPIPDPAWLRELVIELIGWWHGLPLAAEVPPPQIERMPERPRPARSAPRYDGPAIGWDPWTGEGGDD